MVSFFFISINLHVIRFHHTNSHTHTYIHTGFNSIWGNIIYCDHRLIITLKIITIIYLYVYLDGCMWNCGLLEEIFDGVSSIENLNRNLSGSDCFLFRKWYVYRFPLFFQICSDIFVAYIVSIKWLFGLLDK